MISTRRDFKKGVSNRSAPDRPDQVMIKTIPADGKTAAELFRKLKWNPPAFLLEGTPGGWFDGRFSLLGGSPFARFQSKGEMTRFASTPVLGGDRGALSLVSTDDPFSALQVWLDRFQSPPPTAPTPIPFMQGGAVGFFSYDLARRFEKIPPPMEDDPTLPDIDLLFLNFYAVLDHTEDQLHLVYHPLPEIVLGKEAQAACKEGREQIEIFQEKLEAPEPLNDLSIDPDLSTEPLRMRADLTPEAYLQMVRRAQEYISAGDIFQANLSHRFTAFPPPHAATPGAAPFFEVYQRLRQVNPSPFSAYLDMGEIQIASASPERLVRIRAGRIETRPIAGTRPRGKSDLEEEDLIRALYGSEKERAEHLMLVDLERNDLGRVCRYGAVRVEKLMALEKYSHVMHLVSQIQGELRPGISSLEALKAVFPGGTITGVPKVRCMEIIAELERRSRGIYTGAIGYIGFDGEIDLNIAIRTSIRRGAEITFQVGAGIVSDSDPEMEYQETLQKAAALIQALEGGRRSPSQT